MVEDIEPLLIPHERIRPWLLKLINRRTLLRRKFNKLRPTDDEHDLIMLIASLAAYLDHWTMSRYPRGLSVLHGLFTTLDQEWPIQIISINHVTQVDLQQIGRINKRLRDYILVLMGDNVAVMTFSTLVEEIRKMRLKISLFKLVHFSHLLWWRFFSQWDGLTISRVPREHDQFQGHSILNFDWRNDGWNDDFGFFGMVMGFFAITLPHLEIDRRWSMGRLFFESSEETSVELFTELVGEPFHEFYRIKNLVEEQTVDDEELLQFTSQFRHLTSFLLNEEILEEIRHRTEKRVSKLFFEDTKPEKLSSKLFELTFDPTFLELVEHYQQCVTELATQFLPTMRFYLLTHDFRSFFQESMDLTTLSKKIIRNFPGLYLFQVNTFKDLIISPVMMTTLKDIARHDKNWTCKSHDDSTWIFAPYRRKLPFKIIVNVKKNSVRVTRTCFNCEKGSQQGTKRKNSRSRKHRNKKRKKRPASPPSFTPCIVVRNDSQSSYYSNLGLDLKTALLIGKIYLLMQYAKAIGGKISEKEKKQVLSMIDDAIRSQFRKNFGDCKHFEW